ncbi:MAG: hypothetical protein VKJ64_15060 [Leptolyngbyaceae bacterium]|nr:hypothetical protein [Leptolyngbyaceae bacterium]
MNIETVTVLLEKIFGDAVDSQGPDGWVVQTPRGQLLLLLSEDQSWLRGMVAIAPIQEAQPYLRELLAANFDDTQETRYALADEVLWGVFQHSFVSLTEGDLERAIARLIHLGQIGLRDCFSQMTERQIRQIIWASKKQGQSLETTMKTLQRFYEEGMLGGVEQAKEEREAFLQAWHYQLERLWHEVEDE